MKQMLQSILQNYGNTIRVLHGSGEEESVRAFLQPVTTTSWQNMQRVVRSLGEIPTGQYLYIGPADTELEESDLLQYAGRLYRICRTETVCTADEALYIWALLLRTGGPEE